MTLAIEPPTKPFAGIASLELEITGKCQLACSHCLTESSPQAKRGAMTSGDWHQVIRDAATLGIPHVQLIGGEPTTHPQWREFAELALSLGLSVEVYSNLFHVRDEWWDLFTHPRVSVATSYYSDQAEQHEYITNRPGSHDRTRSNIREAVRRGVRLRAGMVEVFPGQRVRHGHIDLQGMGVKRITTDRARAVGRQRLPGQTPTLDEMCGRCTRGRAAVLPNGNLAGCVLARDFPAGNVRQTPLAELLGGDAWAKLAASIPAPTAAGCSPDDSACQPGQPACLPKFPNAPETQGGDR
ncbi:radical SAM protein [Streptomyces sp. JNUCC 64]